MMKSLKISLATAAALGSLAVAVDTASAMPITGLEGVAAPTASIEKAGWVCGPYRCFYRRPYYYRPYRRYYY